VNPMEPAEAAELVATIAAPELRVSAQAGTAVHIAVRDEEDANVLCALVSALSSNNPTLRHEAAEERQRVAWTSSGDTIHNSRPPRN